MLSPGAIAVILAIVGFGLVLLALRLTGTRKAYNWQPDLSHRTHELDMSKMQNHSAIWLTEKSAEERHEERRDYLRERVKNERHQDLD